MELMARERMWQSRNVCYLVTEEKSAVAFAPHFTNGTRTGRPHGGWIPRVPCAEGVDEERKTQAEELAANVAGQLVAVSDIFSADLDELIKALGEHEFQNEEYPVDFYLADADPILTGLFGDEARLEVGR